jgi:hypothetical protein
MDHTYLSRTEDGARDPKEDIVVIPQVCMAKIEQMEFAGGGAMLLKTHNLNSERTVFFGHSHSFSTTL